MIQHGSCGWVCHPQFEQGLKISPWVSFGSHYTTGIVDSTTTAGRVQVVAPEKLLVSIFIFAACWCVCRSCRSYPPVIKHGNRKSPIFLEVLRV